MADVREVYADPSHTLVDLISFPELSDDLIERQAAELLAGYRAASGMEASLPVPVEVIAEQYLGYDIDIRDDGLFSDPDYLGGIIFDQNVIQVNAVVEAHEGRYNFTLAHEIGHHVLHRERYLAARDGDPCDILCRDTGEKPIIEAQADRFAAALLMPADEVTRTVEEYPFKRVTSVKGLRAMAAKVIQRGGFDNVSNTAMVNRLISLGYANGALYQTGTAHDFSRGSGYIARRSLPAGLQGALWKLYSRFSRRKKRSGRRASH
jgi:IrrE N-terminal-like domain